MAAYPIKTKKIISKIDFSPDPKALKQLKEKIKQGFGKLIFLNQKNKLTIQFHGKFKSFIIGIGINPDNESQPEQILLRIDSRNDQNHINKNNAFSNKLNSNKIHIHWNNSFIPLLLKVIDNQTKNIKKDYALILKKIYTNTPSISENDLKEAIPFKLFSKIVKSKDENKSISQYFEITLENSNSYDSLKLLNKIINKKLSIFK